MRERKSDQKRPQNISQAFKEGGARGTAIGRLRSQMGGGGGSKSYNYLNRPLVCLLLLVVL